MEGVFKEVKEDDIYLKFGHLNNSDIFLDKQTDRQTDRQTDIVVYREVIFPKRKPLYLEWYEFLIALKITRNGF